MRAWTFLVKNNTKVYYSTYKHVHVRAHVDHNLDNKPTCTVNDTRCSYTKYM